MKIGIGAGNFRDEFAVLCDFTNDRGLHAGCMIMILARLSGERSTPAVTVRVDGIEPPESALVGLVRQKIPDPRPDPAKWSCEFGGIRFERWVDCRQARAIHRPLCSGRGAHRFMRYGLPR